MSQANFLTIDGFIGPTKNPQYPNAFEVSSYYFAPGSRSGDVYGNGPEFHFQTKPDKALANFQLAATDGLHIKKIILVMMQPGKSSSKASIIARFTFTDAFITSFQTSGEEAYVSFDYDKRQDDFGVALPGHATVQPKHWHMIQHLLSKAGQQIGSKAGGKR